MANIGFLNANERGSFIGKIETLAFTNVIALRPVQSSNPNAPKYDMMARSAANSWIKIGGEWIPASEVKQRTELMLQEMNKSS
jgi:uncharacterized protein (DUF736 family)